MTQKLPSPQSHRPKLSLEARARRQAQARRRRQILVGTLFAAVALGGVLAWQRLSQPDDATIPQRGLFQGTKRPVGNDAALNGGVLANAVQVQRALEAHRQEHGKLPPDAQAFNQDVLPRLDGGKLPRSPWGGTQTEILSFSPDLQRAVATQGDQRWVVGSGRDAKKIERPSDFGALVYEVSGSTYRIYGIGRGADGQAVVLVRLTSP